jgi:hypothetical protein
MPTADRDHQFDVAETVLVADQVGIAVGQLLKMMRLQAADVPVVDHDSKPDQT